MKKAEWHQEARRFYKKIVSEYEFSGDELNIVDGICQHLSMYWKAAAEIQRDGLTIHSAGGLIRKHPAIEVSKISWQAFLAGCRHLGICTPETEKKPVGRPGSAI